MQDVIIPQINGDVSHPFDAHVISPVLVSEKQTIAPLEICLCHVFSLLHLRACGGVEQRLGALIKGILHKGRAIEFLRGKPF